MTLQKQWAKLAWWHRKKKYKKKKKRRNRSRGRERCTFHISSIVNMLRVLRFILLPAAESISVCAMHVIILCTASIARDSDARMRVKETRKREGKIELGKWGEREERALSSACDSRQGLNFYVIVKYAPTKFSFFFSYGGTFSKPCQRKREREREGERETQRQKSNFVALEIRTIERETEKIKI